MDSLSRRQFTMMGLGAAALLAMPRAGWCSAPAKELSFYHLHTGEKLRLTYCEYGRYIPAALAEVNHFLRDFRTGDVHNIDPLLLDQLYRLQKRVGTPGDFHVISGYRSPATNQMLHAHSDGVATHSLHLQGQAIDIRLPGRDLADLHDAALAMQAGGVGYYPGSDFIHLDTGRLRHWG